MPQCLTQSQFVHFVGGLPIEIIEVVNQVIIVIHATAQDTTWIRIGDLLCTATGHHI